MTGENILVIVLIILEFVLGGFLCCKITKGLED